MTYTYKGYPDYNDVRDIIVTTLAAVPAYGRTAILPFFPADLKTDTIALGELVVEPNQTFGGQDLAKLTVYILTADTDGNMLAAQRRLAPYMARGGIFSIRAALLPLSRAYDMTKQAMGGTLGPLGDIGFGNIDGYRTYNVGSDGRRFPGCQMELELYG